VVLIVTESPATHSNETSNNPYLSPAMDTQTSAPAKKEKLARIALWSTTIICAGLSAIGSLGLFSQGPAGITSAISYTSAGALLGLGTVLMVIVLVRRQFRSMHPGYWFAIATLPALLGNLLSAPWAGQPFSMIGGEAYYTQGLVSNFASAFAQLALFALIARFTEANRPWRIYAWTFVVLYAIQLLHLFLGVLFSMTYVEPLYYMLVVLAQGRNLGLLASFIMVIAAITNDGRKRVYRDKIHWLAILLAALQSVTSYLWPILTFYFPMR
jgi:hypothetical protein